MLIDFDHGGNVIRSVPFLSKYSMYLRKLASNVHPLAISTVKQAFHAELVGGIVTTSWVPGARVSFVEYVACHASRIRKIVYFLFLLA